METKGGRSLKKAQVSRKRNPHRRTEQHDHPDNTNDDALSDNSLSNTKGPFTKNGISSDITTTTTTTSTDTVRVKEGVSSSPDVNALSMSKVVASSSTGLPGNRGGLLPPLKKADPDPDPPRKSSSKKRKQLKIHGSGSDASKVLADMLKPLQRNEGLKQRSISQSFQQADLAGQKFSKSYSSIHHQSRALDHNHRSASCSLQRNDHGDSKLKSLSSSYFHQQQNEEVDAMKMSSKSLPFSPQRSKEEQRRRLTVSQPHSLQDRWAETNEEEEEAEPFSQNCRRQVDSKGKGPVSSAESSRPRLYQQKMQKDLARSRVLGIQQSWQTGSGEQAEPNIVQAVDSDSDGSDDSDEETPLSPRSRLYTVQQQDHQICSTQKTAVQAELHDADVDHQFDFVRSSSSVHFSNLFSGSDLVVPHPPTNTPSSEEGVLTQQPPLLRSHGHLASSTGVAGNTGHTVAAADAAAGNSSQQHWSMDALHMSKSLPAAATTTTTAATAAATVATNGATSDTLVQPAGSTSHCSSSVSEMEDSGEGVAGLSSGSVSGVRATHSTGMLVRNIREDGHDYNSRDGVNNTNNSRPVAADTSLKSNSYPSTEIEPLAGHQQGTTARAQEPPRLALKRSSTSAAAFSQSSSGTAARPVSISGNKLSLSLHPPPAARRSRKSKEEGKTAVTAAAVSPTLDPTTATAAAVQSPLFSTTSGSSSSAASQHLSESARSNVSLTLGPILTSKLRLQPGVREEGHWESMEDEQLESCFPDRHVRLYVVTWNMQERKVSEMC